LTETVLIVGSGAREHALAWKIKQSPQISEVFVAPGNGGIHGLGQTVPISVDDFEELARFAHENQVDLTVVGPEVPLAQGIVDGFQKQGLRIFGPSQSAAALEASKVFAKDFMSEMGIPTASYRVFSDHDEALSYVNIIKPPVVVKADGLAAGKGVIVCQDRPEAEDALKTIMIERAFGSAGDRVIVEDCLQGEEASLLAFTDGKQVVPMISVQDHKPVFDGDHGPNTGGMGCYAPAPVMTEELLDRAMKDILVPTVKGMADRGMEYKGILYAGLMLTEDGLQVLEYNCRFGDPETQVIVPLLDADLVALLEACMDGNLDEVPIIWRAGACVCVVLASGGYPGSYQTGKLIQGLEDASGQTNTVVFHAGTERSGDKTVTAGGRVLGVTSWDTTIQEAIDRAYHGVNQVSFEGMHFRHDIGAKALRRSSTS
jgi:phosphoribosylamine--glycine ligase